MVLYPDIADKEAGYVMVMRDHLPAGWRGLLLGAFFAAYMSTISTQLNWGTSYIVNDFYRRFMKTDGNERHYVLVSRIVTLAVMAIGAIITFYLDSIRQAWEFVLESGAGIGLVLILRWYWWRINAWSEITAMVAAAVTYAALKVFTSLVFPYTLLVVVACTTVAWIIVTMMTPPEPDQHLIAFYRRTRPDGPGWRRIAALAGGGGSAPFGSLFLDWIAGVALIYSVLFGVGALLFADYALATMFFALAGVATWYISFDLKRRGWSAITE